MQKILTFMFVCLFNFSMSANNSTGQRTTKKYNILIIHSYQFNLEWTKELNRGIETCLNDFQINAEIFSIHLDTKRVPDKSRQLKKLETGLDSYFDEEIDLIIACDDAALYHIIELNHPLSQKVPIVFCGVENLRTEILKQYTNITGVTEPFDYSNTFKLAKRIFPKSKYLYIVTENSESGKRARSIATEQLDGLTANIQVEYIDGTEGISTTRLFSSLKDIPKESLVILNTWTSGNSEYLQEKDYLPILTSSCPAPLFTVEEMNIGYGVTGGFVSTGYGQAYQATTIAIEILQGKKVEDIPVQQPSTGDPIFDYKQLKRWDIKASLLPENSILINKPLNFLETHQTEITIAIIAATFLLLLLVFIVLYHFKYRAKILEKNKEVDIIQQNLIEQKNELSTTLNSIADGVISVNTQSEVISINPVAMDYLGLNGKEEDHIGKDINNLLHITCTRKDCTVNKLITTAINSDGPTAMHDNALLVPLNSEKSTIFIAGNISKMIDDNGRLYGAVIVFRDITNEHQQKEELIQAKNKALESDKLKTAFLANMSHEIRTPLNSIVGFANLLAGEDYDPNDREQYIQIINTNCEVLLGLITDILDLSRIESGTLSFRMEECTVNTLVENLAKSLENNTAEGVMLCTQIPDEEIKIITDNLRLTQVLTNLTNNAIKFTREGSITIGFDILKGNNEIHFYVQDTGCGMSKEDLKNIFGRFYKKDEFAQGAGLGLAICDAIVEKFGGIIKVDSEIGKGTRFDIYLPYFKSGNFMHPDVAEANMRNKMLAKRKKVILVAEDDDSNYKLIEAVLMKEYSIIRAWNGEEAIEIFHTRPVDLILLDIKMPSKTGLEALVEIRKISSDIPIIMQTAYAFSTDRRAAIEAGCDDFITKPLQVDVLKNTLKKYLDEQPKD